MTFELDENGLTTQTQAEIAAELGELLRAIFGVNLKISASSLMGQLINAVSEGRALDQEAALAAYESFDPNGAAGRPLDARLTLTGSERLGATNSFVDGILTWTGAGTMNNGDLILNSDNNTQWELTSGPITVIGAGTSAAQFTAVDTGPIEANAGTTWTAVTVVPNLTGFTNPTDDAELGRDQESDGDARTRRVTELHSQGQGPLVTIRGAVSQVDGVTSCRVYHNATSWAPVDGIPFKAFNVVVETNPAVPTATQQQAIYDATWTAMGAGGEAYGTSYTGTTVDSEGTAQPMAFDVVALVDIDLEIDLVTSTTEDPITPNLNAIVAAQILATAQANYEEVGRDVKALDFEGIVQAMLTAGTISGVDDVVVRMAIVPGAPALVAKLAISIRQKPDFDSANILVAQT